MSNGDEYAQYLHGCFSGAVRRLQETTNTPESLQRKTLALGRLEYQASKQTGEVEAAEKRAAAKHSNTRYKG